MSVSTISSIAVTLTYDLPASFGSVSTTTAYETTTVTPYYPSSTDASDEDKLSSVDEFLASLRSATSSAQGSINSLEAVYSTVKDPETSRSIASALVTQSGNRETASAIIDHVKSEVSEGSTIGLFVCQMVMSIAGVLGFVL